MSQVEPPPAAPYDQAPHAGTRVRRWATPPDVRGAVTLGELAIVAAAVAVAVVALTSLATAHLRVLTLGAVAGSTIALLAILAVLAWWAPGRPRVVLDLPGLAVLAVVALVAAWFYLPGFHYAAGDRDPGGYVMHAVSMARTHAWDLIDPVVRDGLPHGLGLEEPPGRFLGATIADPTTGQTIPIFYHLWPALLATAWNVHGWGGLSNVTPLVGVLSTLAITCLCRRVALRLASGTTDVGGATRQLWSLAAATVGGAILATNMLQVWQAKYPTAEMLSQLLFATATLCLVLAVDTRWCWPAGVCGALVAMGYLARADGVLIVAALIGLGALVWVAGQFDARAWWCTVGLAVVLPYALWQAYGPAERYTTANLHVPLPILLAGIAAVVAAALVLRRALRGRVECLAAIVTDRVFQRRVGVLLAAALTTLFVLGLLRPLFGQDLTDYNGRIIRTYDELSVYRLSWFFTWPGWALLIAGWWLVLVRRWRLTAWLVLVPLAGLLPLYAWHAENSPWLMWWGRRFLPTVLLGVVVLMAVAAGFLLAVGTQRVRAARSARRAGGGARATAPVIVTVVATVAAAAIVVGTGVTSSLPLRSHDEWGGSYDVERTLTELDPAPHAVFLWQPAAYCCAPPVTLFAGPLWMIWDQTSVLLPDDEADVGAAVQAYLAHFPDEPVYVVYERGAPPEMPGITIEPVRRFVGSLPRWQETFTVRPSEQMHIPYAFTVYRAMTAPVP